MADIKQDLFGLEYSADFTLQGIQEADINLSLTPAPPAAATITGTVTDGTDPIPDATVKLFDSTGTPFQHTLTDAAGQYTLNDVPAGSYTISAVAEGYLLSAPVGVAVVEGGTSQVDLTCTAGPILATVLGGSIVNLTIVMTQDARTYNGTVSGIIRDQNGIAVAGCFVGLYQVAGVGDLQTETLRATTKTNTQGMYLFGVVTGGQYLVKAKLEQ